MVRRSLLIFLVISFGTSWLICLPIWLNGRGASSPDFGAVAPAMMLTPSLAVIGAWLVTRPRRRGGVRNLAQSTGLGLGPRWGRTIAVIISLWAGIPIFVVITVLISALLGLYRLDLAISQSMLTFTIGAVALTPIVNAVRTLGEEWGWRGWLFPALIRYGMVPAILISGVVWGLWHAPLTLLGYNYGLLGPWAALMFIPFCVAFGAVLAWTRWFTGSVWPAVVGHGMFNGSTGLVLLFGASDQQVNFALVGPIGVIGIVLFVIIAALLFRIPNGEPSIPADHSATSRPRRSLDDHLAPPAEWRAPRRGDRAGPPAPGRARRAHRPDPS